MKLALQCLALTALAAPVVSAETSPNILVIMADDLGASDLGCYGAEIHTPHLDRLAENGVAFSRFYNHARCCPSRAALLTGRYAHQAQLGWMTSLDEQRPGYRDSMSRDVPTIAEVLSPMGYDAHLIGKWHVSGNADDNALLAGTRPAGDGTFPLQRGFDTFYGILSGGNRARNMPDGTRRGGYFAPMNLMRGMKHIPHTSLPADYYMTTAFGDEVVKKIINHKPESPLFMYYAPHVPHAPIESTAERVDRTRDRYRVGYEVLWQKRVERQRALGYYASAEQAANVTPTFDVPWIELSQELQEDWIEQAATHAAMVEALDEQVGRAVAALQQKGMYDNTMIFFFSDNGAAVFGPKPVSNLRGALNNAPYHNYKTTSFNGGISSPLIVHYPNGLDAQSGFNRTQAHITDILPTILHVTGISYPEFWGHDALSPLPGTSLLELVEDDAPVERTHYFEHEAGRAIIKGNWKLVRANDRFSNWQLHDLSVDLSEQHNVIEEHSELAAALHEEWSIWAKEHDVLPSEYDGWGDRMKKYKN